MLWSAVMLFGLSRLPAPNVVTEHHVGILARLDNGDFAYYSDEKPMPKGDTYRPCPDDAHAGIDTEAMLTEGVGYEADYAVWQERGTCRSIVDPAWQFWWRDAANNFQYVKIKGDYRATTAAK